MRIGISNIAWDVSEDEEVARLLQQYGVDAIDIAPGKYFPVLQEADPAGMEKVVGWWKERGIEITGMQSLLFGTSGLNLFAAAEIQTAMLGHLEAVCRVGSGVGAKRLVFGSPKNRDRSGLSDDQAVEIAIPFFRRLGDIAGHHGVFICLEPNPPCYGSNFMMSSEETADIVTRVAHEAVRMQLDAGAIAINREDPRDVVSVNAHLIGHVHASEPELVTLGDGTTDHAAVAGALSESLPDCLVTIEMVAAKHEPHLSAIERALRLAIEYYRGGACIA